MFFIYNHYYSIKIVSKASTLVPPPRLHRHEKSNCRPLSINAAKIPLPSHTHSLPSSPRSVA